MPDYSKGKIYTIRNKNDTSLIYVGSTIQPLSKRLGGHRRNKDTEISKKVNGEWDKWYIELYELCPCNCREELLKKEGEIIRLIGTINKNIAGRTREEYRIECKYKDEEYKEKNKDKIKEKHKKYREQEQNKEKQKKYREEHKEKQKEYHKIYREEHKEILTEKRKELIICNCGCEITKIHLKRHQQSKKHLNYINSLISN